MAEHQDMRRLLRFVIAAIATLSSFGLCHAQERTPQPAEAEDYVRTDLPPGFQVIVTELEGPVFADARGRTLYKWPYQALRNGYVGDEKNKSACTDTVTTTSAGLMSPYPPGLVLPELDKRPSCAAAWPPLLAAPDAQPVDKWSFIVRKDGSRQWAYDGHALYTSILDEKPGDVLGGTARRESGAPAGREPVAPAPNVPPGFAVLTTARGRLVVNDNGFSVYASDQDRPGQSNCHGECARTWLPVLAPALAQPRGEWSLVGRAPGVRQWAFRGKPLYTYSRDVSLYSQQGSDVRGWHNVYTQRTPDPPEPFTFQDTQAGVVVADGQGRTVYVYTCADDSTDQLSCDYPGAPVVYRLAICGGGDIDRCLQRWRYVQANTNAKSNSRAWSVIEIEPRTGDRAMPGSSSAQRVWAYRGRPVYTYAGDNEPGEIKGNSVGEWSGNRNGFRAFWVRDDFFRNDT